MTTEETIARAAKIVAGKSGGGNAGFCTLAQLDLDDYPTAATISVSKAEGIRALFFCTGIESNWARRNTHCNRASVCFNSGEEGYNITLVGDMEVVTDMAVRREMWYDGMGTYFTGPEDPGFCVLRFTTRRYSLMVSEAEGVVRGEL